MSYVSGRCDMYTLCISSNDKSPGMGVASLRKNARIRTVGVHLMGGEGRNQYVNHDHMETRTSARQLYIIIIRYGIYPTQKIVRTS
jgi:hypothetical protein